MYLYFIYLNINYPLILIKVIKILSNILDYDPIHQYGEITTWYTLWDRGLLVQMMKKAKAYIKNMIN